MRKKKIRFLYMVIVGLLISLLMKLAFPASVTKDMDLSDYLTSILITIIVWEGNLRIDTWMNKKYPWLKHPWKRILVHFPVCVIYSAIFIFFLSLLSKNMFHPGLDNMEADDYVRFALVVLGILVLLSLFLLSIEVSVQFFRNWKNSQIDNERIRSEYLQARLQNLINQVNPHFLFNNLSVLSSLIYKDQDKAVDFINQLSKVYRYLLDTRDSEMVSLSKELEFIRSYVFLLKIRFEDKIQFRIEVPEDKLNALIPQMSLQMLIENAMKHNESSENAPLRISIETEKEMLVVTNNLQIQTLMEAGPKTGLQNIKERYRFFTDIPIELINDTHSYIVKIPLLKTNERNNS
jgi:two-component system, LytTR family, sensor kinase